MVRYRFSSVDVSFLYHFYSLHTPVNSRWSHHLCRTSFAGTRAYKNTRCNVNGKNLCFAREATARAMDPNRPRRRSAQSCIRSPYYGNALSYRGHWGSLPEGGSLRGEPAPDPGVTSQESHPWKSGTPT